MEILIYFFIFIIGSFIGSFASLAIHRLPLKEDILYKHSYCPKCKEKLTLKDLIPIFSYIFLKGKCSHCGNKIRPRYLILEIVSGILFTLFVISFKINIYEINILEMANIGFITIFITTLILIAGIDKEKKTIISNILLFQIIAIGIYAIYGYFTGLNIAKFIIIFILMFILYLIGRYLIKNEKYKYFINLLVLLLFTGAFCNIYTILLSSILTIVLSFIHRSRVEKEIPFAFYYVINIVTLLIINNFLK